MIDLADLRDKVIVSMLELGEFRIGILVKLKCRYVKRDLEKLATAIHIHIQADITKRKHTDYDTFLGAGTC
jgi:hypothetical protein